MQRSRAGDIHRRQAGAADRGPTHSSATRNRGWAWQGGSSMGQRACSDKQAAASLKPRRRTPKTPHTAACKFAAAATPGGAGVARRGLRCAAGWGKTGPDCTQGPRAAQWWQSVRKGAKGGQPSAAAAISNSRTAAHFAQSAAKVLHRLNAA